MADNIHDLVDGAELWGLSAVLIGLWVLALILHWRLSWGWFGVQLRPDGLYDRQPLGSLFVPWDAFVHEYQSPRTEVSGSPSTTSGRNWFAGGACVPVGQPIDIGPADIRPFLQQGFPWHQHDRGHEHLTNPDAWWAELQLISRWHGVQLRRCGLGEAEPKFFQHALQVMGHPARRWMVGDNPIADVHGAQSVGIPALLVDPLTSDAHVLDYAVQRIFADALSMQVGDERVKDTDRR